ncbi:hypothetical protein LTR36_009886 [Oleoguttula mirabilis]|uniref:UFSP1/2/DUB catalytic domain-containing protein n=1 Tax=Oleoguttula mirabilis TaxID=1507867 RepID=A0AAV9J6H8_9PEZI|nr:hypothetical protein LTR36_009886 [Oleoguttula mirabilis]
MAEVACPFCGIVSEPYVIELHIDESHTEPSPSAARDAELAKQLASHGEVTEDDEHSMPGDEWTKCTRAGCGEYVLMSDIDEHLEVHAAIASEPDNSDSSSSHRSAQERETKQLDKRPTNAGPRSPQKLQKSQHRNLNDSPSKRGVSLLEYFSGSSNHGNARPKTYQPPRRPGRLGKRELGPHAFEKAMPFDVRRRLLNEALPQLTNKLGKDGKLIREAVVDTETTGLIPVLADLCSLDSTTQTTYFCDPSVKHIRKLNCDGNFCGFWNIQVLLSFLQAIGALRGMHQMPDVLQIQDTIEQAWDRGICSYGRIETGGIRGTRKWIGTSEAVAYFTQIGVSIEALSFQDDEDDSGGLAVTGLLDYVEAYFMSGLGAAKTHGSSHITQLAPIYFQRLGHSMTIVGLERKKDGSRDLLVFDSSFGTSEAVKRLLSGRKASAAIDTLMKAYRRSDQSLARWDEFEIVV